MTERNRYFKNSLPDYTGGEVTIDREEWKKYILDNAYNCDKKQPANSWKNVDGGLYVGSAGIAYMFYHLARSSVFEKEKPQLLAKGLDVIKQCEAMQLKSRSRDPADKVAFLLGEAGISAVSAALHYANGDNSGAEERLSAYASAAALCSQSKSGVIWDELFVGRAGYICGALWLKSIFNRDVVPFDVIDKICKTILESGRNHKANFSMNVPLIYPYYDTYYLGAAHGISSILQMILSAPTFMQNLDPVENKEIFAAVDFVLSLQYPSGNFPCAADDRGESNLVHWCHGAPGVVYLMAKAYLQTQSKKYLDSCLQCGEITWRKGLLKKGPGICHGVAGSGYVFLLLYRLTKDTKHLHRANEFAKFLKAPEFTKARVPDCPYSLYEGTAGTICFLVDLLNPSTAAFPFMDVFS
ncbi:hypothetical protein AAG570_011536 [Ranatra chinensis]|uniref:LanC-like protein 3 homolog n=1 Tax=Ranatra chinensis TaxID=642074 RepID=A0ABD0YKY9_9HEMI